MTTQITYGSDFTATPAAVHAAFLDEAYWRARLADIGGPGAALQKAQHNGDQFEVTMLQTVAEELLPTIVTKVRSGDIAIERAETWGPLTARGADGTIRAKITVGNATITGDIHLTPTETGSHLQINGSIKVGIPLVGGKIEQALSKQLLQLLEKEAEFTQGWLGGS